MANIVFDASDIEKSAEGTLKALVSGEPVTVEQGGSPELFQRGETYRGALLVDRQHPHDLFVELALRWERPLSRTTAFILYLSPWGEPAVGPTAYPHRLSASEGRPEQAVRGAQSESDERLGQRDALAPR